MKKLVALILLVAVVAVSFCSCKAVNKKLIEGTWALSDGEGSEYGTAIKFSEDGYVYYGLKTPAAEVDPSELEKQLESFKDIMNIKYEVISDSKIKLTTTVFGVSTSSEIEYSIKLKELTLGDSKYTRVK